MCDYLHRDAAASNFSRFLECDSEARRCCQEVRAAAKNMARYHRSMKAVIKLEHYFPWEMEAAIRNFVHYTTAITSGTRSRPTT
jgi:hypothetical protein